MDRFLADLYTRRSDGVKLGLDVTRALAASLGNPHRRVPCIHVAGTNGKGSVCALLHAVLCAAGCRAALYTSPHLVHFRERFRVGDRTIDDQSLMAILEEVELHAEAVAETEGLRQPTFFEFTTVAAFAFFARAGAEVSVLETGLGGALDSTNIVDPLVSVITGVDIDHTGFLGDDLASIAREKAGIIKPGRPVVCAPLAPEARQIVTAVAREQGAPLQWVEEQVSIRRVRQDLDGQVLAVETQNRRYPPLRCPLLGRHQVGNVAVAVAAVEALTAYPGLEISTTAVRDGVEGVRWPGRAQILSRDPLVILDAAHNPDAAKALLALVKEVAGGRPQAWVVGFSRDKDATSILRLWARTMDACWAAPLGIPSGAPAEDTAAHARSVGLEPIVAAGAEEAVRAARAWAEAHNGVVIVAGSVYLAGDILTLDEGRDADEG